MRIKTVSATKFTRATIALLFLLVGGTTASALPIISVDMDPTTAGIQSSLIVTPTTTFDVDVIITGVDATSPLNGFEFDLDFDSAVLSATSVVDGGFLLAPAIVLQNDVTPPDVMFAAVTLLPAGAVGSGILASITFDAIGIGSSVLDLNDAILAAPFGIPIPLDGINDGTINVAAASVPEPTAGLLLALGLIALLACSRRRRRS